MANVIISHLLLLTLS